MGMQKPKLTLALQLFTNGLNIILDLIFVWGLGWGVGGGFATVVAQGLSSLLGWQLLRKGGDVNLAFRHLFQRGEGGVPWRTLVQVNGHLFGRTVLLMGALAYFTATGAQMGTAILAANAILMNLQYLLSFALDGFAHAAESLVGEGFGKKDLAHVDQTVRWVFIFSGAVAAFFTVFYACSFPLFVRAMTSLPEVVDVAMSHGYWIVASPLICGGVSAWTGSLLGPRKPAPCCGAWYFLL